MLQLWGFKGASFESLGILLLGCFHCRLEIQNSGPPHPFAAIKVHTINHTQQILQFFFSLGIDICMQRDISAQCDCQHTVLAQQGQHGPADKSEGASCAHMLVVHAMQSRPCGASEFGKAQLWLARQRISTQQMR